MIRFNRNYDQSSLEEYGFKKVDPNCERNQDAKNKITYEREIGGLDIYVLDNDDLVIDILNTNLCSKDVGELYKLFNLRIWYNIDDKAYFIEEWMKDNGYTVADYQKFDLPRLIYKKENDLTKMIIFNKYGLVDRYFLEHHKDIDDFKYCEQITQAFKELEKSVEEINKVMILWKD